jgi:hypothetical protein
LREEDAAVYSITGAWHPGKQHLLSWARKRFILDPVTPPPKAPDHGVKHAGVPGQLSKRPGYTPVESTGTVKKAVWAGEIVWPVVMATYNKGSNG